MTRRAPISRPFARLTSWIVAGAVASASSVALVTTGFGVATTFSLPACNLKSVADGGPGSCPSVTVNRGNGETACGDNICSAGTYCVTDAGSGCATGCMASVQCPFGNYCNLSNPTPDLAGNMVGVCEPPTLQQQQAPCPDDAGSGSATDGGRD